MSLSERLDKLREIKRQQLMTAVRAGAVEGVQPASALRLPARQRPTNRDAAPLVEMVDGCRFEYRDGQRVLIRHTLVPLGDAETAHPAGYRCPLNGIAEFADRDALGAIYPGLAEVADAGAIAFVDTETTGLAGGAGTCAFLVAIGWVDSSANAFVCEQYLIEDFEHERLQLELVVDRLASFGAIASYNGKRFDVPLLRARGTINRIPPGVWRKPHADLLFFSRRLWRGAFCNVTLGTVEREVLGITRDHDLPGSEIPQVWQDFHSLEKLALILHHNAQDIVSLAALMARHVEAYRKASDPRGIRSFHEAAGLARWFERRREWAICGAMYERAVDLAPDADASDALLFDHARVRRRMGDWQAAVDAWTSLSRRTGITAVRAGIELAKVAEHRDRNHEAALARVLTMRNNLELEDQIARMTGRRKQAIPLRFLEDLDKREARLRRKLSPGKGSTA